MKAEGTRGQSAALPEAGYDRPRAIDESGLVVTNTLPDGSLHVFDYSDLQPISPLLHSLVEGFARASGSGGRWRSTVSMRTGQSTLRRFYRFLLTQNPAPQSIAELGPSLWRSWRDDVLGKNAWPGVVSNCRALLQSTPGVTAETLEASRPRLAKPKARTQLRALSRKEFRRVKRTAWHVLRAGVERIRNNGALVTTASRTTITEDSPGFERLDRVLEQFVLSGSVPRSEPEAVWLSSIFGDQDLRFCFFFTAVEAYAGMLLLTALRGYNPSTLFDLTAAHQRPDGGVGGFAVVNIETKKDRRGPSRALSHDNLVNTGPLSAAMVYELIRESTEPARRLLAHHRQPTELLFVARSRRSGANSPGAFITGEAIPRSAKRTDFADQLEVVGDDGSPLEVTLQRLRLTEQVINRVPRQNSSSTHDRIYVLPERSIEEGAAQTIRSGQGDAIEHARTLFRVRALTPSERQLAQTDPDELASMLGIARERLRLLLAGHLNTPVAACKDFDHSPLSSGGTCRVSFLHCFACSNAIAAPEHLPRLVCLHDALTTIASAVSTATWNADYLEHFARLDQLLTDTFSMSERAAARARITENEREAIDALLGRRLDA